MNPYRIKAQAPGGRARVDIYGDIGPWANDAGQFRRDVLALGNVPIDVHISSGGGIANDGVNMHTFLASLPDVHTYADAAVASAATLPFLAGKKRYMATGASLMIHNAWDLVAGDAKTLRKAADDLEFATDRLAEIYAKVTGKAKDAIRKMMDETTWLDGAQAIADGWATDAASGSTARANIEPGRYKGTPQHLIRSKASVSKTAPEAARNAFDKGVQQVEAGLGGDGLEPATVKEARSLKAGDTPTDAKIRKAYRWWARNERFLEAEADTPADVSANLWGGAAGRDWFRALYNEMEQDDDADAKAQLSVESDELKSNSATANKNNSSTDTMNKLLAALAQAGLVSSPTLGEDAAIAELNTNTAAIKKQAADAQASLAAQAKASATALVDAAVADGRIKPDVKDTWVASIVANADTAKLLAAIERPKTATGATPMAQGTGTGDQPKTLTEKAIAGRKAAGLPV